MASDVVKGGWAPEEDERLVRAIEKYGTRLVRTSALNDSLAHASLDGPW